MKTIYITPKIEIIQVETTETLMNGSGSDSMGFGGDASELQEGNYGRQRNFWGEN